MDILKRYEESRTAGMPTPQNPAPRFNQNQNEHGFLTRKLISLSQDKIRDGRQAQVVLLVLSGVSISATMFILFDFVSSTPPAVDPLPVGAFPTLELRRRGAENSPPLAAEYTPAHEKKISIRASDE